jgi:hypothetical protein
MYETVFWHRPSDVRPPGQSPRLTKTEEQTCPEPTQGTDPGTSRGEFLKGKSDSFSPLLDCPGAQVFSLVGHVRGEDTSPWYDGR